MSTSAASTTQSAPAIDPSAASPVNAQAAAAAPLSAIIPVLAATPAPAPAAAEPAAKADALAQIALLAAATPAAATLVGSPAEPASLPQSPASAAGAAGGLPASHHSGSANGPFQASDIGFGINSPSEPAASNKGAGIVPGLVVPEDVVDLDTATPPKASDLKVPDPNGDFKPGAPKMSPVDELLAPQQARPKELAELTATYNVQVQHFKSQPAAAPAAGAASAPAKPASPHAASLPQTPPAAPSVAAADANGSAPAAASDLHETIKRSEEANSAIAKLAHGVAEVRDLLAQTDQLIDQVQARNNAIAASAAATNQADEEAPSPSASSEGLARKVKAGVDSLKSGRERRVTTKNPALAVAALATGRSAADILESVNTNADNKADTSEDDDASVQGSEDGTVPSAAESAAAAAAAHAATAAVIGHQRSNSDTASTESEHFAAAAAAAVGSALTDSLSLSASTGSGLSAIASASQNSLSLSGSTGSGNTSYAQPQPAQPSPKDPAADPSVVTRVTRLDSKHSETDLGSTAAAAVAAAAGVAPKPTPLNAAELSAQLAEKNKKLLEDVLARYKIPAGSAPASLKGMSATYIASKKTVTESTTVTTGPAAHVVAAPAAAASMPPASGSLASHLSTMPLDAQAPLAAVVAIPPGAPAAAASAPASKAPAVMSPAMAQTGASPAASPALPPVVYSGSAPSGFSSSHPAASDSYSLPADSKNLSPQGSPRGAGASSASTTASVADAGLYAVSALPPVAMAQPDSSTGLAYASAAVTAHPHSHDMSGLVDLAAATQAMSLPFAPVAAALSDKQTSHLMRVSESAFAQAAAAVTDRKLDSTTSWQERFAAELAQAGAPPAVRPLDRFDLTGAGSAGASATFESFRRAPVQLSAEKEAVKGFWTQFGETISNWFWKLIDNMTVVKAFRHFFKSNDNNA